MTNVGSSPTLTQGEEREEMMEPVSFLINSYALLRRDPS